MTTKENVHRHGCGNLYWMEKFGCACSPLALVDHKPELSTAAQLAGPTIEHHRNSLLTLLQLLECTMKREICLAPKKKQCQKQQRFMYEDGRTFKKKSTYTY